MCVISVLPKGTEKHTQEVENFIKSGYYSNTQGSGFMWKKNGIDRVGISKGYFNLKALLDDYNKMEFKPEDEVVVHHRIGTSGAKNEYNTHPFYIHEDILECTKTSGLEKLVAVCHNGVFSHSKVGKYMTNGYSDTVAFANKYMTQPGLVNLLMYNPDTFESVTDDFVDGDKLCFLFPNRDLIMIGNYIEDNGYYHSNMGYKRHTHNVGGVEYPTHEYEYGYGNYYARNQSYYASSLFDKEYDSWYKDKNKSKTKESTSNQVSKRVSLTDIDELFEDSIANLDHAAIVIDCEYLKLNKFNYKNFWLTPKKDITINGNKYGDLFEIIDFEGPTNSFSGPVLTTIKAKESKKTHLGFKLSYIEEKFNIIPKQKFVNIYRDYLYLYFNYPNISNKKIKLIHKELSNNYQIDETKVVTIDNLPCFKLAWQELYNQNCDKLSDLYTMIEQETKESNESNNKIIDLFNNNVCTRV